MAQLDGKVALVTGGASGIGAQCALTLSREGARVVVTDIDGAGGAAIVADIEATGGEACFFEQDVTDEARWVAIVAGTEDRFGRLDILVSNAGILIGASTVTEMPLDAWRRMMAINLDGVFLSVKHCMPAIRRGGRGGSIILLSSVGGLRGGATAAGYCATKGGVRLFAKAVAMECAEARDGIRVNSIHPGIIETPIWGKYSDSLGAVAQPATSENRGRDAPLGHAGTPQDIAEGVLFLASDASRYMTGSELVIDGGLTATMPRKG